MHVSTTPWPALAALVVALLTVRLLLLARALDAPPDTGRSHAIDGLRGYLAFFVYLHHAAVWQGFLHTQRWETPASRLWTHFGQSSVALFFMVTAFLFCSKLLDGRRRQVDWLRLAVSRVLRLAPLYGVVLLLLCAVVAWRSGGELHEPPARIARELARWASFTAAGSPDVNGVRDTRHIVAGVTWSLPYEWAFYAALPLLARLAGSAVSTRAVLAGGLGLLCMALVWRPEPIHFFAFGGGAVAALAVRSKAVVALATHRAAHVLLPVGALALVVVFPGAYAGDALALLTLLFVAVACGNDAFGALSHRLARALGELSYSVYLLHGLLLYVVFMQIVGVERAARLSTSAYWLTVIALTPVLLGLCACSFRWVEQPALRRVPHLTGWLRRAPRRLAALSPGKRA